MVGHVLNSYHRRTDGVKFCGAATGLLRKGLAKGQTKYRHERERYIWERHKVRMGKAQSIHGKGTKYTWERETWERHKMERCT